MFYLLKFFEISVARWALIPPVYQNRSSFGERSGWILKNLRRHQSLSRRLISRRGASVGCVVVTCLTKPRDEKYHPNPERGFTRGAFLYETWLEFIDELIDKFINDAGGASIILVDSLLVH